MIARLLTQQVVGGVAETGEKPELLWERPDLEGLFVRLEDEFEIKERDSLLRCKLTLMCRLYGVTRAGYYAWRARGPSQRARGELVERIRQAHRRSHHTYGSQRVYQALRQQVCSAGENRIARVMRQHGIKARVATIRYTNPTLKRFFAGASNEQLDMALNGPDQVWVGDITYLKVGGIYRYLAVVMDKYSRRVIGRSCGHRKDVALTLKALGITQSMNRPGKVTDNAYIESFFHSMKSEIYHGLRFDEDRQISTALLDYMPFYIRGRLHSSLNYVSPATYEKQRA